MKRKSLTLNGIYSLVERMVNLTVPLIVLPYIMRVLGAESYGKVTYVESIVSYFTLLATLGVSSYAQRECAVIRDNRELLTKKVSQVFTICMLMSFISLAAFLLVTFFAPSIATDKILFLIFSITILASGLNMSWLYGAQERFDLTSIREISAKILYLVLCFLLIKGSGDYYYFAFIVVLTTSLFQMLWNLTGVARGQCGAKPNLKEATGFSSCFVPIFYLALMTIGSKLFSDSDILMIKWFVGEESDKAVGLYNSAILLPRAFDTFLMSISAVMTPRLFIYVRQHNEKETFNLLNNTSNILFFLSIPAIITCLFFSNELIQLFAGDEYAEAAPVLQIYSLVMFGVLVITLAGTRIYIARQKEKKLFFILICGASLNILLNILLIKLSGIKGAAIATLTSYLVVMVTELSLEKTWKYIFSKDKVKYIVGGLIVAGTFTVMRTISGLNGALLLFTSVALAGALYVIYMLCRKEYTTQFVKNKLRFK